MALIPLSYWHHTATEFELTHDLPAIADVVVIGGGIVGSSATYALAKRGVRVVQLEQHGLANGATGRNGGFLTLGAADSYSNVTKRFGKDVADQIMQHTLRNRELMRQVIRDENIACDYREPGTLSLALSDEEQAHGVAEVAVLNANGYEAVTLDRHQLRTFVRTDLGEQVCGATYTPNTGLLHSAKFVWGLAQAAQRHGAVQCVAQAMRVEPVANNIRIHTNRGSIETPALIVAANAWTQQLVPQANIKPVRGQVVSFYPAEPVFAQGMAASVTPTGEYWQQTPSGEIVLGGCRAAHPTKDENLISNDTSDDVQHALENVLPALFPKLANLRVQHRWAGPMAFTPDFVPIADRIPALPNAWFAGGFCGHGMPFGMVFGEWLAGSALANAKQNNLAVYGMSRSSL